ncbi:MAG: hypothetical protein K2X74_04970 [Acetobacteraceae bacterium]|nr:hypothetical protein [Acetobacteraceae bacterium]
MANGRPGDSISHDILHHGLEVFGPAIDSLVREIDARIVPTERDHFILLIETWPFEPNGTPRDPELLHQRLLAIRGTLAPAGPKPRLQPLDDLPPLPAALPPRRAGSALAALVGLLIGGFIGLALGILAWLVLRVSVIPPYLWHDEELMRSVIGLVALPAALIGAVQGGKPTRLGHTLMIALLGFFVGGMLFGLGAGLLALMTAAMAGRPAFGGGLFQLIGYNVMPLAAAFGGALLAGWTARRAWRDWLG